MAESPNYRFLRRGSGLPRGFHRGTPAGLEVSFVLDNQSLAARGMLLGSHSTIKHPQGFFENLMLVGAGGGSPTRRFGAWLRLARSFLPKADPTST
jgi:hypothetical protein